MLVLPLALAAACAAAPAPSAAQAREAARVKETLAALGARMRDESERFTTETLAEAALLAKWSALAPGDPAMKARREALLAKARAYHEASVAEAVATTLMARRLQAFKATGVLPPETPDDGSLRRALEGTPPAAPEARPLEMDLVALMKQLGLPPLPALPAKTRDRLAAPPAVAKRAPAPERAAPLFMPDRGRGRAAGDPVPGLIIQLSDEQAPIRALAADELAGRGRAAASAVPALRRALADADPRVRASSAAALGAIVPPDSDAVQDLRRLLADRDEDVRFSARAALRRLGRAP